MTLKLIHMAATKLFALVGSGFLAIALNKRRGNSPEAMPRSAFNAISGARDTVELTGGTQDGSEFNNCLGG